MNLLDAKDPTPHLPPFLAAWELHESWMGTDCLPIFSNKSKYGRSTEQARPRSDICQVHSLHTNLAPMVLAPARLSGNASTDFLSNQDQPFSPQVV